MVKIKGTAIGNILNGTKSTDTILGGGGNDLIYGLAGDDELMGQDGDDRIFGGAGNDVVFGEEWSAYPRSLFPGNDYLDGGPGSDRVNGGPGNDIVIGGDGHDGPAGGRQANASLNGGPGSDYVYGDFVPNPSDPNDPYLLYGGNDYIDGGAGGDHLWGGRGHDLFSYDIWSWSTTLPASPTSTIGPYGVDTIYDFNSAEDFIQIGDYAFSSERTPGVAKQFTLTLSEDGQSTRLEGYWDADEIADLTIIIMGNHVPIAGTSPTSIGIAPADWIGF